MQELNFVKEERLKLQNIYFKDVKSIWTEFEGEEAEDEISAMHEYMRRRIELEEKLEKYET